MKDYFNSLFENRSRNFANAREVGNYFNRVKRKQSSRLEKRMHEPDFDKNEYKELRVEDFPTTD
jgi:hypothetical protein